MLDVVLATVGLCLAMPVLVGAGILIWMSDRQPVLFSQERIGRHGVRFRMLKLRTMVPEAEARLREVKASSKNLRNGPMFKAIGDPRVTRVGRMLRATSIDELPQLWNVLRGDMSLVGPRPALPCEVVEFTDRHLKRHAVRPGVTGLWQVTSRDCASFEEVERHDIFYVENWSIALDLWLLIRTAQGLLPHAWRELRADGTG